jgi:hypothetical protein
MNKLKLLEKNLLILKIQISFLEILIMNKIYQLMPLIYILNKYGQLLNLIKI